MELFLWIWQQGFAFHGTIQKAEYRICILIIDNLKNI